MQLVTQSAIDQYLRNDTILAHLDAGTAEFNTLTCQRWLRDTPAKRYMYALLYGDLLQSTGQRVLDVGGGLTAFTPILAAQHDYTLVELMAHDTQSVADGLMVKAGKRFIEAQDWHVVEVQDYDIVIANDLFPNVDQRLEIFLQKMLPVSKEIRLSLTYYDTPRFYTTKRVNAEEYLTMLAWDSRQLRHCLTPFAARIVEPALEIIGSANPSAYANGRQVCLVTLRGDLARG